MAIYRSTAVGTDPDRHLIHALAALREATECLEDAAAAGERTSAPVATAISHVSAARSLLEPEMFGPRPDQASQERDAA